MRRISGGEFKELEREKWGGEVINQDFKRKEKKNGKKRSSLLISNTYIYIQVMSSA